MKIELQYQLTKLMEKILKVNNSILVKIKSFFLIGKLSFHFISKYADFIIKRWALIVQFVDISHITHPAEILIERMNLFHVFAPMTIVVSQIFLNDRKSWKQENRLKIKSNDK